MAFLRFKMKNTPQHVSLRTRFSICPAGHTPQKILIYTQIIGGVQSGDHFFDHVVGGGFKIEGFSGTYFSRLYRGGGVGGGGIWGGSGGGILGPGYILTPWPRSSWFEAVETNISRFTNICTAGRRVAQFVHISANLLLYGSADCNIYRSC